MQGGSSITQQLAKNLFLTNERSISRKIKEAYLALWLEHHLTKKEILKLYLDRAYMGGGAFGVQAAAQFYFGKSARDINLAEAAMLAGPVQGADEIFARTSICRPRARAPTTCLSNLVDAGFMTEGQVYAARRNPATPVDHSARGSPDWYLDFAYDEVKALADDGKLGDDRVLTVRTGLDIGLQLKAESVHRGHAARQRAGLSRASGRRRSSPRPTASCAPSSAGATTARASSTAPPTRCASPAPRSSRSSI